MPPALMMDMEQENQRELLLSGDEEGLETTSLLALLLGSTTLAAELMARYQTLGALEQASPGELLEIPALGQRRVTILRAALALMRRRALEPPLRGRQIRCSEDVYELLGPVLRQERREILLVLALDTRNRLLRSPHVAAVGSLSRAVVEPRELLRPLILAASAATILAHNHPSLDPEPSDDDVALSRSAFEACAMLGIRLLDHVIIGDGAYVSLADRGLL